MIVLLLAAAVLFSAGAAHHAAHPHAHAGQPVPVAGMVHHHELAHEHQHGNDWAPQPSQRIRVLADVVVVVAWMVADPSGGAVNAGQISFGVPESPLSLSGVLRI